LLFRLPIVLGKEELTRELFESSGWRAAKYGFKSGFVLDWGKWGGRVFYAGSSFLVFLKPIEADSIGSAVELALARVEGVGKRLKELFPQVTFFWRADVVKQHLAQVGGVSKWIPDGFRFEGDR
jgi:hypothetical protein